MRYTDLPGGCGSNGSVLGEVPGVIVRICKHRVRLKVLLGGVEKHINVDLPNVICLDEACGLDEPAFDSSGILRGKV